jgi:hypothetical protein
MSIIKKMWEDSEEYKVGDATVRRVFAIPNEMWYDPEEHAIKTHAGTSDLNWCTRVVVGEYFAKAGWPKYQEQKWPFLVDTNIFSKHINQAGEQFPMEVSKKFKPVKEFNANYNGLPPPFPKNGKKV